MPNSVSRRSSGRSVGANLTHKNSEGKPMRNVVIRLLLTLVISACAASTIWAQATAQISGTVKDSSGAVLPGVEITVTQTETGIARSTISNETGSYVLANL